MIEFVEINGARLAYESTGPEDAPLMITLHGGRGMGDHYSDFSVYGRLAPQLRVVSFDFRGHGQSSRTPPYSFAQLADDIDGLRRHFVGADGRVIICGGSFGGFLALHYAIQYAQHVTHLILRGTAASHHHEQGAIDVLAQRLHKVPSFSLSMLKEKVFGAYTSDEEFRLVHFAMMPLYSETYDADRGLQSALRGVYVAESHNALYAEPEKWFDYRADLHKITAKTLVVVGDKDWICPPENSQLIADNIPGAELFTVENANHSVHLEKPDIVLAKIRWFLT